MQHLQCSTVNIYNKAMSQRLEFWLFTYLKLDIFFFITNRQTFYFSHECHLNVVCEIFIFFEDLRGTNCVRNYTLRAQYGLIGCLSGYQ